MRKIYIIHQWVSLICALFLLLLTLTGLPLLFRGEISAWNTVNLPPRGEPMALSAIWAGLPQGTEAVTQAFPTKEILAITPDGEDGTLYFRVKERGGKELRAHMRMGGEQIVYDVRTGTLFPRQERVYRFEAVQEFMHTMHILHVRMGMEEGGRDFLAAMCVLSVISIVSGVYLYLPMMKTLAFGTRRRRSSRLFWSDWHKLTSVFAGTWAALMCVSGVFIVLYSVGMRDYQRTAQTMAAEHFSAQEQSASLLLPEEALAQMQEAFPAKDIISMRLPTADSALYAFQIAEPTVRAMDFALGTQVYLAAGGGEPFLVPVPAWLTMAPFFLNLHIHNHEMTAEKIFWALLILMTAAMIVTGIVLWLTRWRNRISKAVEAAVQRRTNAAWEESARIAVLTLIVLIAPMYGSLGDGIALAVSAYLVYYFVRAVRG
jgi:hypothetical protein